MRHCVPKVRPGDRTSMKAGKGMSGCARDLSGLKRNHLRQQSLQICARA
ncbi:MAG: hypothetical protein ACI30J_07775 [Paludibacteraceae bacterium]